MNDDEYRNIGDREPVGEEALEETLDGVLEETALEEAALKEEKAKANEKAAMRMRRRRREKKNRERQIRLQYTYLIAAGIILVVFAAAGIFKGRTSSEEKEAQQEEQEREEIEEEEDELLSDSVLRYRDLVEYYAEEEGIEEYVPVLLAIMETETRGERDDVMQSSESAGLEPNTLGPEDSIAQACDYFRGLVVRAEDLGCDTKSIIQAYNYGPGYLYYVAENGGKHSFDLAVDYAEVMSDGRTAAYTNEIADDNGNWMYLYGNMYYVKLVEQYLP